MVVQDTRTGSVSLDVSRTCGARVFVTMTRSRFCATCPSVPRLLRRLPAKRLSVGTSPSVGFWRWTRECQLQRLHDKQLRVRCGQSGHFAKDTEVCAASSVAPEQLPFRAQELQAINDKLASSQAAVESEKHLKRMADRSERVEALKRARSAASEPTQRARSAASEPGPLTLVQDWKRPSCAKR